MIVLFTKGGLISVSPPFVLRQARDLVYDERGVHPVFLEEPLSVHNIFQDLAGIPFQSGAVYHELL